MSTTEEADELVRELTDAVNAGDYDAIEGLFADGYGELWDNAEYESVDELLAQERERADAFEGKHEEIDTVLVDTGGSDGVHLDAWYTVTGTHVGEFINIPPTGNEVEFPMARILVVEDGEITRYRLLYTLGFLLDLGLNWDALTDEVALDQYLTTEEEARAATDE
ncbi:MAG: ester cyclase [Halobacteriaceae archaeon]